MLAEFTEAERKALKEFRLRVGDIIKNLDEYDSDDRNIIRWLRARDLNLDKAENMMRTSYKVREELQMDKLQYNDFPELLLDRLPFTPCGYDKNGIIICVIPFGRWDFKSLVQKGHREDILQYLAQIFERYFRHMKNTHSVENLKTQVNLLIDCDQFSLKEVLSKQVLGTLIEMMKGYEADYPERLRAAYVVNIPKVFEVLWSIMKPLLAVGTLSKVRILGGPPDQWRKVLLENIDQRELPSQYGGSNTAHPFYSNRHGDTWPARSPMIPPEEFLTTTLPPREKTDFYDIGFEFQQNGVALFPYARADAHIYMQDGCHDVVEDGTYSLVFDNTYSKYRSKTVHHAIRIKNEMSL